jgi:phosphoribosylanthranilate isomerase
MIIKVCGITRPEDAEAAVRHGATALGFNFWPKSPRYIAPERAGHIIASLPDTVAPVGVFVDTPVAEVRAIVAIAGLAIVQLHGQESVEDAEALGCEVWKAMRLEDCERPGSWPLDTPVLLDAIDPVTRGGTGTLIDWDRARACARARTVILAGGLTPENVGDAVGLVRPAGVDVSSGVERAPGIKDETKIQRFIHAARQAEAGTPRNGRGRGATT